MPLQRQVVTLPFALGVDTKTDDKQVAAGKQTMLENGVFTTLKQLQKRNGYTALPRDVMTTAGFSRLDTASALTSYRDELLALGRSTTAPTDERLFSYSDGSTEWVDKGALTTCSASTASVSRSTVNRTCVDGTTTATGLQVYAWEEAGAVRYSVVDTISGQLVLSSGEVAPAGVKPRVLRFAGGALVYYLNASVLYVRSLLPSLGASLTATTALTGVAAGSVNTITATAANQTYDLALYGDQILLAFTNDAGTVSVRRYDANNPLAPAVSDVVTPAATPAVVAIATDPTDQDVRVVVGVAGSGGALVYSQTDALLTTAFPAMSTYSAGTAGEAWIQAGIVAVPTAPLATRWRTWATQRNTTTNRVTTTGFFTGSPVTRSFALASKPWAYGGRAFVALVFPSQTTGAPSGLQNQLVVVSDSSTADPVARLLYTTSAGVPTTAATGQATLPASVDVGGDLVRFATLEAGTVGAPVGDVQTVSGVTSVSLDFSASPLVDNRSELGGSLIFGGGLPTMYDGVGVVELGFMLWPDECTATLSAGGSLSAGAYQWVAVYEWADNNGFVHRSAPSLPTSATAASGDQATLAVSCLPLSRKDARAPVQIVLYRTLANGSVFYRASSLTAPTNNNPSAFAVSIVDGLSDATLATRPQLYTTGGVVENIPPGALDGLAVHRGRLWGVDATNRLRLWFSRQVQAGAPVEFSDVLVFDVDARGGDVVALASLDDKLIIFKRSQIFMVAGQGPDATGSQNDFSDAVLVTTDAGCLDARSIVMTPSGLMFQSAKGIYLLDRSLSVSYVGADVEAYNSATVESSQLIPTANQVRFVLSSGIALVFDYLVGQWSVFTNHPAVDSAVWLDTFCWLRENGVVMREDSTRYDDDGAFVSLKVRTSWIVLEQTGAPTVAAGGGRGPSALQGFQRARRMLVLGEYAGAHRLRVRVGFDYSPAPLQDVTITPTEPPTYGEGPTYGDETPYGGDWRLYQWRVDLVRQKCQAVQVTISDERDGGVGSAGVRLSALSLELGLKPGTTRVANDRIVG